VELSLGLWGCDQIVDYKLSSSQIKSVAEKPGAPTYIKYTPSGGGGAHNSGAGSRVIRMSEVQVDPLEPPKFRHTKVRACAVEGCRATGQLWRGSTQSDADAQPELQQPSAAAGGAHNTRGTTDEAYTHTRTHVSYTQGLTVCCVDGVCVGAARATHTHAPMSRTRRG
jgi:hypothetical protein